MDDDARTAIANLAETAVAGSAEVQNLMPLGAAAVVVWQRARPVRRSWSAMAFAGVTTSAIVLTHAAWLFDWGATRTGSSTAGLLLVVSPIYSVLLGAAGWAIVRAVLRSTGKGGDGQTEALPPA